MLCADDGQLGYDEVAVRPLVEPESTDRDRGRLLRVGDRSRLGAPDGSQVGYDAFEAGRVAQPSRELEQGGLAETEEHEPVTLYDEACLVGAGPQLVEEPGVDGPGLVAKLRRPAAHGAALVADRVAVTHCAMQPLIGWWRHLCEPGQLEHGDELRERGQVGDRPGQVPVGRAVGEECPDQRDGVGEPDAVPQAEEAISRLAHLEERQPASRAKHAAELAHGSREIGEVAHGEPAHDRVHASGREGKRHGVGLDEGGASGMSGGEHSEREVDPDRALALVAQTPCQVSRAATDIEHHRCGRQAAAARSCGAATERPARRS